jgi:glycosyltransferase involved in cell wall biosynthesis
MSLLSVVVPAYQEEATILQTLERIVEILDSLRRPYEVIVVSDGNTDQTAARAKELRSDFVTVLDYPVNKGKGFALRSGVSVAKGDLIAFIDGDLDIHPEGIIRFVEMITDPAIDAVVASKSHPDSLVHYPLFRRLQSRTFRLLVRLLFTLDVSDTQTGLKLFRREVLDVCLPHVTTDGFAFDLELLVLANDAGFRVIEGPVQLDFNFTTTTGSRAVIDMIRELFRLERSRLSQRRNHTWVSRQPAGIGRVAQKGSSK